MTKEQLKYLALLPQMIDALNAFAAEAEALRAAAARAGFGPPPVRVALEAELRRGNPSAQNAQFNSPVNLQTAERAEYKNGNPPATEEDAVGAGRSTLPHLQEARLRRAQTLKQSRQDPARAEKLAQFKHDEILPERIGEESGEVMVLTTSGLNLGGGNG